VCSTIREPATIGRVVELRFLTRRFLDLIFGNYRHVFHINELTFRACRKQEILRLGIREGFGANLPALNNDDHQAIVDVASQRHIALSTATALTWVGIGVVCSG
jgi:hypothetical protein